MQLVGRQPEGMLAGDEAERVVRRSPFVRITSSDGAESIDISPRGDPSGYEEHTVRPRPGDDRMQDIVVSDETEWLY